MSKLLFDWSSEAYLGRNKLRFTVLFDLSQQTLTSTLIFLGCLSKNVGAKHFDKHQRTCIDNCSTLDSYRFHYTYAMPGPQLVCIEILPMSSQSSIKPLCTLFMTRKFAMRKILQLFMDHRDNRKPRMQTTISFILIQANGWTVHVWQQTHWISCLRSSTLSRTC